MFAEEFRSALTAHVEMLRARLVEFHTAQLMELQELAANEHCQILQRACNDHEQTELVHLREQSEALSTENERLRQQLVSLNHEMRNCVHSEMQVESQQIRNLISTQAAANVCLGRGPPVVENPAFGNASKTCDSQFRGEASEDEGNGLSTQQSVNLPTTAETNSEQICATGGPEENPTETPDGGKISSEDASLMEVKEALVSSNNSEQLEHDQTSNEDKDHLVLSQDVVQPCGHAIETCTAAPTVAHLGRADEPQGVNRHQVDDSDTCARSLAQCEAKPENDYVSTTAAHLAMSEDEKTRREEATRKRAEERRKDVEVARAARKAAEEKHRKRLAALANELQEEGLGRHASSEATGRRDNPDGVSPDNTYSDKAADSPFHVNQANLPDPPYRSPSGKAPGQTARQRALHKMLSWPETVPADEEGNTWIVVGGFQVGGILVRKKESMSSQAFTVRLAFGSKVEEIGLVGNRLHYKLLRGEGPEYGWVSTVKDGKTLLERL